MTLHSSMDHLPHLTSNSRLLLLNDPKFRPLTVRWPCRRTGHLREHRPVSPAEGEGPDHNRTALPRIFYRMAREVVLDENNNCLTSYGSPHFVTST
ncbi:hypothetical protein BIW11_05395, partial [Tropilaelaps mercedesae]